MNERTIADERQVDTAYSVLANGERRDIVRTLSENGASLSVTALTDRLAGGGGEQMVGVRLYHQHLPKMEQAGIVDYDRDPGRVSLTPLGRRVGELVERTKELLVDDASPVG